MPRNLRVGSPRAHAFEHHEDARGAEKTMEGLVWNTVRTLPDSLEGRPVRLHRNICRAYVLADRDRSDRTTMLIPGIRDVIPRSVITTTLAWRSRTGLGIAALGGCNGRVVGKITSQVPSGRAFLVHSSQGWAA
jgi:hypothetical protein